MMMMESSNKINITSTISTSINSPRDHHYEDEEIKVPLPGFRFYPTDEELIGFYLRRKVHNKLFNIQFIQQIDIYKYDPWDIPKGSSSSNTSTRGGNNEWYFFCKRGRKYKNSIRPNRVTGSGFWKATGIDKPVHSTTVAKSSDYHHQYHDNCIGLKKTLVYYRGSAGKGIKTDWMMHEFRLPDHSSNHILPSNTLINHQPQEAEIRTLCRIFKRNVAYKKFTTDSRELSAKRHLADNRASKKCNFKNNMESNINISQEAYIDFSAPMRISQLNNDDYRKPPAAMKISII